MLDVIYQLLQHQLVRFVVFSYTVIFSVILIALIFTFNSFTSTAQTASGGLSTAELTRITNVERVKNGLVELSHNSVLATAAQARAQHMIDNNYFSHTYNGVGALDVKELQKLGYGEPTGYIAENLYGTSADLSSVNTIYNQTLMDIWINSGPHYDNILNPGHRIVGFGWAFAPANSTNRFKTVVVAIHANALPPLTTPPTQPPVSPSSGGVSTGSGSSSAPTAPVQPSGLTPQQIENTLKTAYAQATDKAIAGNPSDLKALDLKTFGAERPAIGYTSEYLQLERRAQAAGVTVDQQKANESATMTGSYTLIQGDGPNTGHDPSAGNGAAVYVVNARGERFHITGAVATEMIKNGTWSQPVVMSQAEVDRMAFRGALGSATDLATINNLVVPPPSPSPSTPTPAPAQITTTPPNPTPTQPTPTRPTPAQPAPTTRQPQQTRAQTATPVTLSAVSKPAPAPTSKPEPKTPTQPEPVVAQATAPTTVTPATQKPTPTPTVPNTGPEDTLVILIVSCTAILGYFARLRIYNI